MAENELPPLEDLLCEIDGNSGIAAWNRVIRRIEDIVLASAGIVISLPVLAISSVLIYFIDGPPIIYRSLRSGKAGIPFIAYKLKTMRNGTGVESYIQLPPITRGMNLEQVLIIKKGRDSRVTKLGNLLRVTSIDELPQLLNILRGEMSVIGPRPLPLEEYKRLSEYAKINNISDVLYPQYLKPGLASTAMIQGRGDLTRVERLRLDLEDTKRFYTVCVLFDDLITLYRTMCVVISRRGAY